MYYVFIIVFILIKEATAVNVALGKRGVLCSIVNVSNALFDGNKNISNIMLFVKYYCSTYTYLNVMLEDMIYIHYVIVYLPNDGKEATDPKRKFTLLPMEYFKVHSLKPFGKGHREYQCAQLEKSYRDFQPGQGLRVNCRIGHQPTNAIRLSFKGELEFELSEIEAYSLTSNNEEEPSIFYRGCFSRFDNVEQVPFTNLSACISFCRSIFQPVMAISGKTNCHCGRKYLVDEEVPLSRCQIKCEVTRYCGGMDAFSIYVVLVQLPSYYGCAQAIYNESVIVGVINIPRCLKVCDNSSFVWIKGDKCGCLNDIGKTEPNSTNCNSSCSEHDEYCGGESHASIYSTCYTDSTLPCDLLLQCSDSYDKYGTCKGRCKPGFVGEYCLEQEIALTASAVENYFVPAILIAFLVFIVVVLIIVGFWSGLPNATRKDKKNVREDKEVSGGKEEDSTKSKKSRTPSTVK